MKKVLLVVSTVLAGGVLQAYAADLPSRSRAVVPVSTADHGVWGGLYVGAQGGAGWASSAQVYRVAGYPTFVSDVDPRTGFAGVHLGYDVLAGKALFGFEADVERGFGASSGAIFAFGSGPVNSMASGEVRTQASLRARAGYLVANNIMVYATAGVALADYRLESDFTAISPVYSSRMVGWTLGGGAEVALIGNLRARAEYRYSDFGTSIMGPANAIFNPETSLTQHPSALGFPTCSEAPVRLSPATDPCGFETAEKGPGRPGLFLFSRA